MKEVVIQIPTLNHISQAARQFTHAMGDSKIFAFHAPMGAGKTTFINALSKALGVENEATGSPTFAIINEYTRPGRTPIYHFDLYRIDNPLEALDLGIEDYFDSGNICLLEWPENIESLLPPETVDVRITVNPDNTRTLALHFPR